MKQNKKRITTAKLLKRDNPCSFTGIGYLNKFHITRQPLLIYLDWLLSQVSFDERSPAHLSGFAEILRIKFLSEKN